MVVVKVCVGSSCHLKGSYQVIKTFERLMKQNELEKLYQFEGVFLFGLLFERRCCNS